MSEETKDCEECFGTGNEPVMQCVRPGEKNSPRPCPACGGTGEAPQKEQS